MVNTESVNDQIISNKIINQYLKKLEKLERERKYLISQKNFIDDDSDKLLKLDKKISEIKRKEDLELKKYNEYMQSVG